MTDRIIRIKLDSRQAEQGIDRLDNDMRGLGRTSDGIQTKLTAVASALAAAFSVQQIAAYADAYTNIQNRLRVVTDSTEQLTRVTASLLQTANDTRASFDATSSLYSTLARSTEELAISEERLIAITRTVNQSFAVSGASADEAANAIRQLAQGLSAGALRGDEFNSVAEQAPGILRAVAAETGKTTGELRAFAAEGGITAELLIRAIENYSDVVQSEFDKTNRTFQQSTVVAQNNATAFVGSSKIVQEATQAAGNALVNLTENLDTVALALTTITAVIAGRYAAALVAAAVNTARVTAANLAAKTTYDALGLAVTRTTVAQNASVAASRASAAALALIGGPVGAAILAAGGLAYFVTQAIASQREAERLANSARGLNSELEKTNKIYENYQKSQQSVAAQAISGLGQAELQAQFSKSSSLIAIYKRRLDDLKESGASFARIADVQAKIEAEQRTLDAINKTSPQTAKGTQDLALKLGDLAAQINLTSIEYSVFAERQRLIKDGFATKEIDGYIESYRALLLLQEQGRAKEKAGAGIDKLFSGSSNLFSGSAPDDSGRPSEQPTRSEGSAIANSLDTENQLIDNALALRVEAYRTYGATINDINVGEFERQRALLELSLVEQTNAATLAEQSEIARIEARRQQILENESLSAAERIEINRLLDEQIILQEQNTQQSLTQIDAEGVASRKQLAEAERQTRLMQLGQLGDSLMSLGQGQSKKVFEIGKKLALAQAAIALPTAVMESFKNGGGYPWGLVPAAAMAATGLKNIQNIRSTTYGGGGGTASLGSGGGGGGVGLGGGSTTLPTQPQGAQTVQTLEIRGLDEIRDELRSQDGMVSTRFVATILDKISDANRIRGEG